MAETKEDIIIEITLDREGASKALKKATSEITELTKTTKQLQQENKKLDTSTKEGAERFERNSRVIAANKQQLSELRKEQKLNIQTLQQEDNSLNALRTNLIKLKRERDNINQSTEEGKQRFLELTDQIKETTDEIKAQEEAGGDFRRNVGNYSSALEDAQGALAGMVPGLEGVSSGIGGVTKAALSFIATPIGAIIAAIAIALKAVSNALTRTEKGVKIMNAVTSTFEGILIVVESALTSLGSALISAFEDPIGSIEGLWESLKTNLINRLKGAIEFFIDVGDVIKNTLSGNFDEAGEAAKRAGQNFIQMTTGLDEAQQSGIAEFFEDVADQVDQAANSTLRLVEAQKSLREFNRDAGIRIANLEREIELQTMLADDATKSFKEREEAARQASDLIISKSKEELEIARRGVEIANLELSLIKQRGDTAGEELEAALDAQAEAQKARIEAETQLTLSIRQNELIRSQLLQDRLEKDLDILIDGFDNQKAINERIISDEEETFERRFELLDRTRALSDASFRAQADTIQQFTDQAIDFNDLLATSDATVLNEKIRALGLSEIIEGRLLEVIRERRTVTQDLAEVERDLTDQREEALKKEQEAQFKLLEFRKEVEVETLENAEERIQKEIELEVFRREQLLMNEELLADERQLIIEESEQKISELKEQFREEENRKIVESTEEQTGIISSGIQSISDIVGASQESRLKKLDKSEKERLKKIEQSEKTGLITEKEAEQQRAELERESARRREDLERKQFQRSKIARLAQGAIDTAAAVLGALKNPPGPPATIPFAIAAGAFGAAQLGIIASQKFARGGKPKRGKIGGKRHSEGGTKFFGEDGTAFEAERGEDIFIINRKASSFIDRLSSINEAFGGRSLSGPGTSFAQEGGLIVPEVTTSVENNLEFQAGLLDSIAEIRPRVIVEDIRDGIDNEVEVETASTK